MLPIKRLYIYILRAFSPMFLMTFAICSFILLMQFLWKYVEDMVGKGLEYSVMAELFFYAALGVIPMSLPLAILLASLMTFGNLGENYELTAMKAAGVSLLRIMRPLILFIILITIGAFFFQNVAMPIINVKTTTLLRSVKMKSPELQIPEGSFYNEIPNYNLYVKKKNPETGILYDVKIYDTSKGFDNMAVIVCDSAKVKSSSGKDYLLFTLYHGQQFSNFQKPGNSSSGPHPSRNSNEFVPYAREDFKEKEITIRFDASFNRMDESSLQTTQLAKNITELEHSIDSLSVQLDSIRRGDRRYILGQALQGQFAPAQYELENKDVVRLSDIQPEQVTEKKNKTIDFDSLLNTLNTDGLQQLYANAASQSKMNSSNLLYRSMPQTDTDRSIRQHKVEWHRKFTLSFACFIFFFIGAPLGAIIRKGGLGMPVVVSVLLFIIYYIIDNVGRKMARDGVWDVWQGIWLSSFVLLPLGIFLTYKAMNDSALFNTEAYGNFIRKLLRLKKKVTYTSSSFVDVATIPDLETLDADPDLVQNLRSMSVEKLKDIARNHQQYNYNTSMLQVVLSILKEKNAAFFDVSTKNYSRERSLEVLKTFDISYIITILAYFVFIGLTTIALQNKSFVFTMSAIIAGLVYFGFYVKTLIAYSDFYHSIDKKTGKNVAGATILILLLNLIAYPFLRWQMKKDYNKTNW